MFFQLAIQSLWSRRSTSVLTVISIALSIALLLGVEKAKQASEQGFTQTISKTDLVVGGRSGPTNLILYTLFNIGGATNNISMESYQQFAAHPAVAWTIPISLGDSHRGYRTVGTDENFFKHYHYRGDQQPSFAQGGIFEGLWEVVVGAEVAQKLGYKLGDAVVLTHGVTRGEGFLHHDDKPFIVKGILKPTGTALDRSLYVHLKGIEALHLDWKEGGAPKADQVISKEQINEDELKVEQLTAFLLGTNSRIEILRLQREINTYAAEPLMAVIPGVVLAELWQGLGYFERALRAISWLVLLVGLVSMLIALLTSLNERRREMSILRALGASPKHIFQLMILESAFLTGVGILCGFVIQLALFGSLKFWLENSFGLYLVETGLGVNEIFILLLAWGLGIVIGIWPALRASQMALKDGLSR